MILKIGSVEHQQPPVIKEVEAELTDSFAIVADRACQAHGYHGNYSLRLPSGAVPGRRMNLEDDEEFMSFSGDEVFSLVNVGAEG